MDATRVCATEAREAETAASLQALSLWRETHAAQLGSGCANCGIPLGGPFCVACGQSAESFERSVGALAMEAVEGLFHADSRLWRTLHDLVVRPGVLTRDYLAGRRASQTPPLRLFLVVVVIFFFSGGVASLGHPSTFVWLSADAATGADDQLPGQKLLPAAASRWLSPRVALATTHQREFGAAVENQLHETAILFLPIFTLLLAGLFAFRRRFLIFDHAVFSMHSLSFMGLLFSVITILDVPGLARGVAGLLVLAAPVHLFFHLRATYATGVVGTLVRVVVLLAGSAGAVALLLLGDIALGLNAPGAAG
jgi:hypothetical protein